MIFLRKRRRLSLNDSHNIFVLVLASLCVLPAPVHSKFRICGFRLTMTMTALCKNQLCGGYFVPTRKRSSPLSQPNAFDDTATENFYERRRRRVPDDHNFHDDEAAEFSGYGSEDNGGSQQQDQQLRVSKRFNMAHGQMYGKRSGIANECCEKRCSLAYLRTYCCSSFQINAPQDAGGQPAAPHGAGAFSYSAAPPLPLSEPIGSPLKHKGSSSVIGALAKLGAANRNRGSTTNSRGISKVKQAMLAAAAAKSAAAAIPVSGGGSGVGGGGGEEVDADDDNDDGLDDVHAHLVEEEEIDDNENENENDSRVNEESVAAVQKRQQQTPRSYALDTAQISAFI